MSEDQVEPQTTTQEESNESVNETSLLELVSDEYKPLVESKGFKDVNDVIKSYTNMETLVGRSVRIPADDASEEAKSEFLGKIAEIDGVIVKPITDEDKDKFYNKLGRPETPDNYDLQGLIDEELSKDIPNLSEEISEFLPVAHSLGLTQEQTKALLGYRLESVKDQVNNMKDSQVKSQEALKHMWGEDFGNRQMAATTAAKMYAEKYPEAMKDLETSVAGSNPVVLNMLAEIGKNIHEQGHAGTASVKFGMTPEEADNKIAEKKSDSGFMDAYLHNNHPNHYRAVSEMEKLYQIRNS